MIDTGLNRGLLGANENELINRAELTQSNNIEAAKKIKCKICGCETVLTKENHYLSRDEDRTGLSAFSGGKEVKIYDTFDCVYCGCQIVIQERKREYKEYNREGNNDGGNK